MRVTVREAKECVTALHELTAYVNRWLDGLTVDDFEVEASVPSSGERPMHVSGDGCFGPPGSSPEQVRVFTQLSAGAIVLARALGSAKRS